MNIKLGRFVIVGLLIVVMGFGLYSLNKKKESWQTQVQALSQEVSTAQNENRSLQANLDYYKDPANLLKELKSQFNYREAGEKLIIIVPQNSTTTTSTAP